GRTAVAVRPGVPQGSADQTTKGTQRDRQGRQIEAFTLLDLREIDPGTLHRFTVLLDPLVEQFGAGVTVTGPQDLLGQVGVRGVELVAQRGPGRGSPAIVTRQFYDALTPPAEGETISDLEVEVGDLLDGVIIAVRDLHQIEDGVGRHHDGDPFGEL